MSTAELVLWINKLINLLQAQLTVVTVAIGALSALLIGMGGWVATLNARVDVLKQRVAALEE